MSDKRTKNAAAEQQPPTEQPGADQNQNAPDTGDNTQNSGGEASDSAQLATVEAGSVVAAVPAGYSRVHVVNNFNLNLGHGQVYQFTTKGTNCGEPGYYDLPNDQANHWYTLANSDATPVPVGTAAIGTQDHVDRTARRRARRTLATMVADQSAQQAAAAARAETLAAQQEELAPDDE